MQRGKNIAYTDHVILGQIIVAENSPDDIGTYECVKNEVKLVRLCTTNRLDKSKILYAVQKIVIPNVFFGIVFKRHQNEMLNKKRKREKENFSKLLYFLPSNIN